MTDDLSLLDCIDTPAIWARWFDKDREGWAPWRTVIKTIFGHPLTEPELELFCECTNRTAPDPAGYTSITLVCGRRAGKSFTLALISVFLAVFRDWSKYLAPGETGTIKIIATDRKQAGVIFDYCRALLAEVPTLAALIAREGSDEILLTNGIAIEVQTASFRSVRGYTVIAACLDEQAYLPTDDSANPDTELLAALRPAMATIPGAMLLCASSPYARRGELWNTYRRYFGQEDAPVLVWQAPTRTMHPSVPQSFIDAEMERSPDEAAAEYMAVFRRDLESYVSREAADAVTVLGRRELPPITGTAYVAFIDPAGGGEGGGNDSMTLAIAHREGDMSILDLVREVRPPFVPSVVATEFCDTLRRYSCQTAYGDRWGGEFVRERFHANGIAYEVTDKVKSDLYRDLTPMLNSKMLELLDHPRLLNQLCSLERRVARGGKDSIDHPPNSHDDLINSATGALVYASLHEAPALWAPNALLNEGGMPAPWPTLADMIFASAAADESGFAWCLWARDRVHGGPPLVLIDYNREPFSRELIAELAKRITTEANVARAPERVLYCDTVLAREAFEILEAMMLAAMGGTFNSLLGREYNIDVRPNDVDEFLKGDGREKLLLAGATAIGANKVRLTTCAVDRALQLPSPLANLKPGADPSAMLDAALIGLGVCFAEPPQRPIVRANMGGR
jgi:hypothetical protein